MNGKRAKQLRRERKVRQLIEKQVELHKAMGSPKGITHVTFLHEDHCPVLKTEGLGMADCECNPIIRPGLPSEVLKHAEQ